MRSEGEFVGGESAVHVGAEGEEVAAADELFDVGDVAEDVGDGGAGRGGGAGDEEFGEEDEADDAVWGLSEGFDLGVGEVAFGVLFSGEQGSGVGVGGDFEAGGFVHDGPEGAFGEVGDVVDDAEAVEFGEKLFAQGGDVGCGLVAAGVLAAFVPGEGDDADAGVVEVLEVLGRLDGGGAFEEEGDAEGSGSWELGNW